jgi:RNA polymerase sigma-70 factor (ECF subfamily)
VARASAFEGEGRRDEVDFQALVDAHYAPLYRFALSLARTEHDAADLVQGAFAAWAAKGHQLQDRTKAKAWLFTTLHREFLQRRRHATRFPHLELVDAEAELPKVEPDMVSQLDSQAVVELLAQVDAQYRSAVALFYLEDYSYLEIAGILEVPIGTVKSRIARGLGQLKALVLKHSLRPARGGRGAP